jgi:hypothetical protein
MRLTELLGQVDIKERYVHPQVSWDFGRRLELDIWIPSLEIAVEYQVPHPLTL